MDPLKSVAVTSVKRLQIAISVFDTKHMSSNETILFVYALHSNENACYLHIDDAPAKSIYHAPGKRAHTHTHTIALEHPSRIHSTQMQMQ